MQAEADRRQNLVDDLSTREKRLNAFFKGDITEAEQSRYIQTFHFFMHRDYTLKQLKIFCTYYKNMLHVYE